jgi:hypothetical protein
MNRFRSAAIVGLTVVLVACSSGGAASTPTPTPSPTPSPTPTLAASSSNALPSFNLPSNAKELEALLPNTLGGVKLTKASMKGNDFVNSSSSNAEFKAFLDSVGKSLNDVSAAFAFAMAGSSPAGVFAFRVQGVDNSKLIDAFRKSMNTSGKTLTWTSANVGGKNVQQAKDTSANSTLYLYGTNDLVFFVTTNDATIAAEALSHLP